jgi:RNA polymerase sigma-70 factor (ECF subfamily)
MSRSYSNKQPAGNLDTREIWRQVHDGLRAFVARRVANEAEVEDILQEVFLRMHRKLDSLKDPRRIVSWLFQITRHAIIDHYRTPARRREMPAGLPADLDATHPVSVPPVMDESADVGRFRTELAGCLRPMIERLPADYRQAVTFVELEGLTQQAAAKRLGLSVSGMKSRVQRGRRQLKDMLEACCEIQLDGRRGVADYRVRDPQSDPCGCSPRKKARA